MRTETTSTATAQSVAFTGHRTIRPEHLERVKPLLASSIVQLYERGFRNFYCGMAVGFDLLAAEIVIDLKSICPKLRLIAAIPFHSQDRFYSDMDKARYQKAISQADERIILTTRYNRHAYRIRNAYLVEHSSHIISYFDASIGISGTGQTIHMAERQGIEITNLFTKQ